MIKTYGNLLVSCAILCIGAVLFVAAQYISVGAAMAKGGDFMPKICSAVFLALGAILFVSELIALRRPPPVSPETEAPSLNYRGLFLNILLIAIYFILLDSVGFLIMTAFYISAQTYLFSPRQRTHLIICPAVGIISSAIIYYLFTYSFQLLLPYGILG